MLAGVRIAPVVVVPFAAVRFTLVVVVPLAGVRFAPVVVVPFAAVLVALVVIAPLAAVLVALVVIAQIAPILVALVLVQVADFRWKSSLARFTSISRVNTLFPSANEEPSGPSFSFRRTWEPKGWISTSLKTAWRGLA